MSKNRYSEVRLGELLVADPRSGLRQRDDGAEPATPFIASRLVSSGRSMLLNPPTEVTYGSVGKRTVQRDDLLLVSRGIERHEAVPCATVKFDEPAVFAQSLIRLRVNPRRVAPDYLCLYLTSRRGTAALAAAATGSVITNLRPSALKEVQVYLPDLDVQREIIRTMASLESHIAELAATIEKLGDVYDAAREGLIAGHFSTRGTEE